MKKSPLPSHLKNIPKGYVYLGRGEELKYPEKWNKRVGGLDQEFQLPDWGWADDESCGWQLVENKSFCGYVGWVQPSNNLYIVAKRDSALHKLQSKGNSKKLAPNFIFTKEKTILEEENARLKEEIKKWQDWATKMPYNKKD